MAENGKRPRGLAALTPDRRREIAAMDGRSLRPDQRTFSQDPSLAKAAGQVGGAAIAPEDRMFSRDPELAARAGRKGGKGRKREEGEPER